MTGTAEIYGLIHPETGELRYVGKARDSAKRLETHLRDCRRRDTPVYRWVRKLLGSGMRPDLIVIAETDDWRAKEIEVIARARQAGLRLLNLAAGGDEPHCPVEVRRANAEKLNANDNLSGYRKMMRRVGQVVRHFRDSNQLERAEEIAEAMAKIRKFSNERKVQAGIRWMARYPYG